MALQIEITTNYGFPVTYWKITSITHNTLKNTLHAEISAYKDKAQREIENSIPLLGFVLKIHKIGFVWYVDFGDTKFDISENEGFSLPADISRSWIYGFIKTLGSWNTAQDI